MESIGRDAMSHILNIYVWMVECWKRRTDSMLLSSLEITRGTWALKWRDGGNLKTLSMGWNGYSKSIKYH